MRRVDTTRAVSILACGFPGKFLVLFFSMKSFPPFGAFLRQIRASKAKLVLGGLALAALCSCANTSHSYYPQPGSEAAYRASHGGSSLKSELEDNEGEILQSHKDAHQGLILPPDQPGIANDGTGWVGYR
jgi:hypothetical protein